MVNTNTLDNKLNETVRLQIEITSGRLEELESLMQQTGTATKKELLNNALTLLEWAIEEKKAGHTIASINEKNETYKELVMPILRRLK